MRHIPETLNLREGIDKPHLGLERARAVLSHRWDNLQHVPMLPDELFAAWWETCDCKDAPMTKIERKFRIFRKKMLKTFEGESRRRRDSVGLPSFTLNDSTNVVEVLSNPSYRVTKRRIDYAEALSTENT